MSPGIAPIVLMLAMLATGSQAAEMACTNIDAKIHYSSKSTAAKTESGRTCTVSIDGANAGSMEAGVLAATCGTILGTEGIDERVFLREIILSVVAASIPDLKLSGPQIETSGRLECDALMSNIRLGFDSGFSSPLHERMEGGGLDDLVQCFDQGRSVDCKSQRNFDGSIMMEFESQFGQHTVYIPAP